MPVLSLRQRIREAQRWLRRESCGREYPSEVDHYLTTLFIGIDSVDGAALLATLPLSNRERLRGALGKYPTTEEGWDRLRWVSGSVSGNIIRARTREEYVQLEQERWEAEKAWFRQGVEVLRAVFASTPPTRTG